MGHALVTFFGIHLQHPPQIGLFQTLLRLYVKATERLLYSTHSGKILCPERECHVICFPSSRHTSRENAKLSQYDFNVICFRNHRNTRRGTLRLLKYGTIRFTTCSPDLQAGSRLVIYLSGTSRKKVHYNVGIYVLKIQSLCLWLV